VSAYLRRAWIVVWKDVLSERRSKESLNALLFFSLLLLFVFQFALGPERARVEAALPGLLWLGFILSGLLAFGRTFLTERENDCWEGLVLTPGDKSAIYLGKLAGNVLLMTVVEAVLLILFAVFFGLDFTGALPALSLVLALGTLGLAAVGTLFGAITAQLRARELLFPVLLLPAVVPVLLASVSATQVALSGQPLREAAPWLQLLGAADLVYLVVGVLTFEFVLEG
jgi:heme exporter protein B